MLCSFACFAMHLFSASAASSNKFRDDQPASSISSNAEQPAASLRSAEQPATSLRSAEQPDLKIASIRDVQRWLAAEHVARCSNLDAKRIREAVAVLSQRHPRMEDVRPLQSKWQVAQKKDKKPRPLGDVLQEFDSNVIRAAQKLRQQLADSAETGMRETQLSATTCAHDDERDVSAMAIAPPGKRFRAVERHTKQQRLTKFFDMPSAGSAREH